LPCITSEFESVELGKQPFDALAHLIALGTQRADFLFHLVDDRVLFREQGFSACSALFSSGTTLALALDEFNGADYTLFECGKIIGAERQCWGLGTLGLEDVLRRLPSFDNLVFNERLGHQNTSAHARFVQVYGKIHEVEAARKRP
jgi:hypothetical protein